MAYRELTENFEVVESALGVTATRVFVTDANGPFSSIPSIGELLLGYNKTVVESRTKTKFGGHPNLDQWTIRYSTNPAINPDNEESVPNTDSLPISVHIGGEFISIEGADSGFKWYSSGTAVDEIIPRKIGTGSFTVTKRLDSLNMYEIFNYAGKINSKPIYFHGSTFPIGTVLFEGADVSEYKNDEGMQRYKIDYSFNVKVVPLSGSDVGGWQYLYNSKATPPKFDLVYAEGPIYLYSTANLNLLIARQEVV
jgi:hypothetical protein